MPGSVKVRTVFRSQFLWRLYGSIAGLIILATMTVSGVFIFKLRDDHVINVYEVFEALVIANGVGIAVALGLGLWIARSVKRSLEEITNVAQSLTCGDFNARVKQLRDDEFGLLGLTLNLLGEELTDRMATLSHERAQLQAMLAGMVEGIIAIGDDDRILFSNRAADRLLKVDVAGARGRQLGHVPGLGMLLPVVIEARKSVDRVKKELNFGELDTMRVLETKAARFKGDQDGGVVVVLHDVTDLRRLERVRRDFVANVSHELKTPLTSIKGYVETLQYGAKDDADVLDRFLKKIDNNVGRLVALVQDILSLASIEGHDGNIHSERIEWSPLVRQVLTHHEHEVQRKKINLMFEQAPVPLHVYGDREAMTQVVDNLVSNAIKYTPEGGAVRLTLRRESDGARFEVRDTGVGIPREHLPRIFERFYRVDKARSRELGGTGLGLSIVKHLVSAMNGRVSVESEPGKGSAFTVTLGLAD